MAITIIGSNLNVSATQGRFEQDPSTWGLFNNGNVSNLTLYRNSTVKHGGNYSGQLKLPPSVGSSIFVNGFAVASLQNFKKYRVEAWVYVLVTIPPGTDGCYFQLQNFTVPNSEGRVNRTVGECKGTWQKLEFYFDSGAGFLAQPGDVAKLVLIAPGGESLTGDRNFFVDDVTVYEYTVDTAPVCTLAIDLANTLITKASSILVNDGVINVAITGAPSPSSVRYSKDNGVTYQSASYFTGLAPGNYTVVVKDINTLCTDYRIITVGFEGPAFTVSAVGFPESSLGANDGRIEVTVDGPGSPFTFAIENQSGLGPAPVFQSSNIFTGLQPSSYNVYVKNNAAVQNNATAEVLAGELIFDKIYLSRNPIVYDRVAPSNWKSLTNFRMYDDVRVEDMPGSGVFVSKLKIALPPIGNGQLDPSNNEYGIVNFQVREAFRNLLSNGLFSYSSEPSLNGGPTTIIHKLQSSRRVFKHYIGNLQNDEVTPSSLTASLPSLVVYGGLENYRFHAFNYFTEYLPATKKFMTWAPNEKQVDANQEDYLNFFVYKKNVGTVKLQCKAYYDDGTNQTSVLKTLAGVDFGDVLRIPAGPANSGVKGVNVAKNLVSYELSLLDIGNAVISEVKTYTLDPVSYPNVRFFMFENSLGALEVMRFYGESTNTPTYQRQVTDRVLSLGGGYGYQGQRKSRAIKARNYNFSSGYFTGINAKEWVDYMEDFGLANGGLVFEVTSESSPYRLKPLVITNVEIPKADNSYEFYFRFEAEDSYLEESYTPRRL